MGQEPSNTSTGGDAPPVSNQPLDLLSDLESRLGQLKDWQAQTDQQLKEMQEESMRIDALRDEANGMQRACEERQRSLDEQKQQLHGELESLASQEQQLDEARQQLEQDRSELEQSREALLKEHNQAETDREAIKQQHQDLARQQEELKSRFVELSEKEAELSEQLEQTTQQQATIGEQQQAINAERDELGQEREALENWQHEIDEARSQFDDQRAELAEQREAVDRHRSQFEADQASLSQQQDDLFEQKKQVERVKIDLKLKAEALQAQQQHLEQAREELVEQAMQVPSDADEKFAEFKQAKAELEQAKLELESRHDELQASMSELDARDTALHKRQEELDDTQAKLEQVRFELNERQARAASQSDGASVQSEELDRKLEDYERKRADLEKKREQFKQTLEQSRQQIEAERAEAHRREAELEARVKELEQNAGDGTAVPVTADDATNQRRRSQLRKYRALLRERSKALQDEELKIQSSSQQFTGLEKERQMLVEVKRFLETSEGEMVKRWATGRAASLVIGAVVMLVFAALASLLAANQLVQPKWQASMMISVTTPEGEAPPSQKDFLSGFEEILLSEPVLNAAMLEMDKADANVRVAASPKELKAFLQEHLVIAGVPGRADLSLQGEDKQLLQPVLASVGKAIVGHNASKDYQAKREPSTRIASPAKLVDLPIANGTNEKFTLAGITFGGIVLVALLGYIFLRVTLNRSKRMFGEEIEELTILDKPETWSPLHAPNK
ncbi:MAG: hypothetical protein AAF711_03070 [Planctomycetota bacterium]